MQKVWALKAKAPDSFFDLHKQFPPIITQLLFNRDLHEKAVIDRFLNPSYERDVHDPFLFTDMHKAVDRIFSAIDNGEKIIVHGDYDADGICGSAVLCTTLSALGADVGYFLPHREKDGYGLNTNTIETLAQEGTNVIITCDCGISNAQEIALANTKGIDVIITDHHQIPEEVPQAYAILHPKCEGEIYPDKTLSGGGVAFKLCQGLLRKHQSLGNETIDGISHEAFEKWLLDLVAVSSVADMVPLLDETRALTRFGLMVLNKTKRQGMQKLFETARITQPINGEPPTIDTSTIGFRIAPRINAAGRMAHAKDALELLLETDAQRAQTLAQTIQDHNVQRQKLTETLTKAGRKFIHANHQDNDPILFVRGDGWSPGIVGLIASRLKDEFYKPVIVLGEANDTYVGSGRSIEQFHITRALGEASHCFAKFGGHPQACGFSLVSKDMYTEFTRAMTAIAKRELGDKELVSKLALETEVNLDEVNWDLWRVLERFAPFGVANPEPLFVTRRAMIVDVQPVGKKANHMRLLARSPDGRVVQKFISFFSQKWLEEFSANDCADIVFEIGINSWNGRQELQLKIVDIKKV